MTAKRFKKLLMGNGWSRNEAQAAVDTVRMVNQMLQSRSNKDLMKEGVSYAHK